MEFVRERGLHWGCLQAMRSSGTQLFQVDILVGVGRSVKQLPEGHPNACEYLGVPVTLTVSYWGVLTASTR